MILLRQKMYTSKATKELRKKILMKSGDIKRFKSEGYRTVEKSKEEIEKDIVKALKNKFGRGDARINGRYILDGSVVGHPNGKKLINSHITIKGETQYPSTVSRHGHGVLDPGLRGRYDGTYYYG